LSTPPTPFLVAVPKVPAAVPVAKPCELVFALDYKLFEAAG